MLITRQLGGKWEEMTAEQVQAKLDEGCVGFLSFMKGYTIAGSHYWASGLTLFPNETKIFERDGKLTVTAFFREYMLTSEFSTGNPENLVPVECVLDSDDQFYVSINEVQEIQPK